MKKFIILVILVFSGFIFHNCRHGIKTENPAIRFEPTDSLPLVLPVNKTDIVDKRLRYEAALRFAEHQLPTSLKDWMEYKAGLRAAVIEKAAVIIDHNLALNIKETGSIKMKNYVIKNISFQTRPGVYATANLFIPDGRGPFPAVINMLGHWRKGKIDNTGPQAVGHTLAASGYVCLTIDPWGAGERGTRKGEYEYHGANLGASLMNIGEPLIGLQISDNMRGIDLLCSLTEVDTTKIGATGASGGGNQTMWLSAVDERVRADVPVVSVGTFESYIMESNCICEQLPYGLTFTEEAGIIALSNAPRIINHNMDSNPTFFPSETYRSYTNAKKIFEMTGRANDISFLRFDLPHGYERQDREAMLGWFDLHLKGEGDGSPRKELPYEQLPEEKLLVFPGAERDSGIVTTAGYCRAKGEELRKKYLATPDFRKIEKEKQLLDMLRIDKKLIADQVYNYSPEKGWKRLSIETSDMRLIPLLLLEPADELNGYVIICNPGGKKDIPLSLIDSLKKAGAGIVIEDLTGTGELTSTSSAAYDNTAKLHTLARAELWLGRTTIGEWIREIDLVTRYLYTTQDASTVSIYGWKEAGLAGLFYGALGGKVGSVTLLYSPVSYLFDNRETVDYFSMGIHIPGFLKWGDVSLAAGLCKNDVIFINPVTMSGIPLSREMINQYLGEYRNIARICRMKGNITFK